MKVAKSYNSLFFLAYLTILCWAPLPLASNRPWAWNLLSVGCLLLFFCLMLRSFLFGFPQISSLAKNKVHLALFFLVPLWVSLQCIALPSFIVGLISPAALELYNPAVGQWIPLSLDPSRTQQLALLSWAFWCFFTATILIVDSPKRLRILLIVLVCGGSFQALYGVVMLISGLEYGFFVKKLAYFEFATGTFVSNNHLASYLGICLAAGIGLLLSTLTPSASKNWINVLRDTLDSLLGYKMGLIAGLILMVVGLILTGSTMGNAAFYTSLIVCGILMLVLQRRLSRGAIVLFLGLLLADLLVAWNWIGFNEILASAQSSSVTIEDRDELLRDSVAMALDYPIAGTGAGAFYSTFPQYQGTDVSANYSHAHNDYLEFFSSFGLIGFIPLVLMVLVALMNAATVFLRRHDQFMKGVAFASAMGISTILVYSLVGFSLQMPAIGLLFVVLLAMASLSHQLDRESRN